MEAPEPIQLYVCSVCGEPWTAHMPYRKIKHSCEDYPYDCKCGYDKEDVDLMCCVRVLQNKNMGPQGPTGPMGMPGVSA